MNNIIIYYSNKLLQIYFTATTAYTYDVENQLVDVKVNNKSVQHNEYNGVGQRIKKVESIDSESGDETKTTNYFYEGSLLLYTTNEQGEKTSQNIVGNASNTFATIRYEDEQKEYFYSKDVQGSTTNITASNGDCVNSYDYTDFGETSERIASTVANEICYTGGVYDKTTELYYLNARYYNPEDGVFMSQDTYRGTGTDVGSWNLYGYCEGNPISYIDPSGHKKKKYKPWETKQYLPAAALDSMRKYQIKVNTPLYKKNIN